MAEIFLRKNLPRLILVSLLTISLLAGYGAFLYTVKRERYQLFNVKKTISWAQSGKHLYRTHAHGQVDNILLSEDSWKSFSLSLRVTNAEDCGLVFGYIDPANYHFIYFKKDFRQIITGRLNDNKLQDIKSATYQVPVVFSVELKKKSDLFQLTVDGLAMPERQIQPVTGKAGLIINSMAKPPTVFHEISIDGITGNGEAVKSSLGVPAKSGTMSVFWKFVPFYIVFVVFLLFVPRLFALWLSLSFTETGIFRKLFPVLFHLFLTVCFFWPSIARGEIAVFSYDNLGEIYPLFYYAKHNFANLLQGQAPWLWNPLIHNGFPFYSNHWDMIYYPLNWPVFLAPEKDLLRALTWKSIIEVFLIGIFAYGFFVRELGNRRWALFSSTAYQMCSILIFTMGIFPATSLYFAMTFYLYALWSAAERKPLTNFLLLSVAVVLILTSANVAFIFYACLSLGAISIYRFVGREGGRQLFGVAAAAWLTGTLISAVRILSCLGGVAGGNRLLENFYTIHDRTYMGIRLFLPEIAGWMGPDAFNVLKSPNLRLIFSQLELPSSNPQNCFFVYFGVLPALLLVASLLIPMKGKPVFWRIYALAALGIALLWQPLWGMMSILSFPFSHYSYHSIILPVGICALIGYAGMAWEAGECGNKNFLRKLILCLLFVFSWLLVFVAFLFPSLAGTTRIIFLVAAAAAAVYFYKPFSWAGSAVNILSLTMLILLTFGLVLSPIPKKEGLAAAMTLPFLWLAAGAVLILTRQQKNAQGRGAKVIVFQLVLSLAAAGMILWSGFLNGMLDWEQGLRVYTLDVLTGFVRLLVLLQIGILAFNGLQKKILSARAVFAIVLSLTAMDLVVFNARFNNITAPFYFKNSFYPKGFTYRDLAPALRQKMDLVNYRIHQIDRKDFNANKNLIYHLPTYTGTVGYMTPRFSKFLAAFGYSDGLYMLYPEDSTDNGRFLDLSAVRYFFDEKGALAERPGSLARLNIIYSSEVVAGDDETLARLTSETFDPRKTVLLSEPLANIAASGHDALMVSIVKNSPDRIEATVSAPLPGILLFAESYDEGWKAFVDDKMVPVVRANYNFMACALGQGEHRIRFVYDPAPYKRNMMLSLAGLLIIFMALFAGAVKFRENK